MIVTSNSTLHDGEYISIHLTDLNNTSITNQTVNITIFDHNGVANHQVVTTDNDGNGNLQLNGLAMDNYTININYTGNEKYKPCNTTQKIEMVEKQTSSQASTSHGYSTSTNTGEAKNYGSYINDEWVPMTEAEYAERYPVLYHEKALSEGKYDEYHPDMYEVDRENGYI